MERKLFYICVMFFIILLASLATVYVSNMSEKNRLCLKDFETVQFKKMTDFHDKNKHYLVLKSLTHTKVVSKNEMIVVESSSVHENLVHCED